MSASDKPQDKGGIRKSWGKAKKRRGAPLPLPPPIMGDSPGEDTVIPPLKVTSSTKVGVRDGLAAIREFLSSGVNHQSFLAPTLQHLLDHCFDRKIDFTLHWSAADGGWSLFHERRKSSARLDWKEQSSAGVGESLTMVAQVGPFRATLERTSPGNWRLHVSGCVQPWKIKAVSAETARMKAAWIIREQLSAAIQAVDPKLASKK